MRFRIKRLSIDGWPVIWAWFFRTENPASHGDQGAGLGRFWNFRRCFYFLFFSKSSFIFVRSSSASKGLETKASAPTSLPTLRISCGVLPEEMMMGIGLYFGSTFRSWQTYTHSFSEAWCPKWLGLGFLYGLFPTLPDRRLQWWLRNYLPLISSEHVRDNGLVFYDKNSFFLGYPFLFAKASAEKWSLAEHMISSQDSWDNSSIDWIKLSTFFFPFESNSFCFAFSSPGIPSSTRDKLSLTTPAGCEWHGRSSPWVHRSRFQFLAQRFSFELLNSSIFPGISLFTISVLPLFSESSLFTLLSSSSFPWSFSLIFPIPLLF